MTCNPPQPPVGERQVVPSSVRVPFGTLRVFYRASAVPAPGVGNLPSGARAIVGLTMQHVDAADAPVPGSMGVSEFAAGDKVPVQLWPLVANGGPLLRPQVGVFHPMRLVIPSGASDLSFFVSGAGPAWANAEVTLFFEVEVP